MNKTSKILVTIVAIFIFFILFAPLTAITKQAGHSTPGILGLILFAGLVGALRAIWKKDDNNKNDKNDTSILQK